MKITVLTGSRADYGLLEWPIQTMQADPFFEVTVLGLWGSECWEVVKQLTDMERPDVLMVLGDRFEILGAATAAHLQRIPIAHIGGGDVTEGSYDDAMRDCITRMATIHFVTSTSAMARLCGMGHRNIHLVGSPGIDYIRKANWRGHHPFDDKPYVVVSYQAETIDWTNEIAQVFESLPPCKCVFIMPNPDRGSGAIRAYIDAHAREQDNITETVPHGEFLNLLSHCEEFVGNSSAMLYEAPELGIRTRMIGKRQRGRTIPWGDGNASERIVHVLKYGAL